MSEFLSPYWLSVFRFAIGLVWLVSPIGGLIILAIGVKIALAMLRQIQSDRLERDSTLRTLRETADALAKRTEEIATKAGAHGDEARAQILDTLETLKEKVDDNTQKTEKIVKVSEQIAHDVNGKEPPLGGKK